MLSPALTPPGLPVPGCPQVPPDPLAAAGPSNGWWGWADDSRCCRWRGEVSSRTVRSPSPTRLGWGFSALLEREGDSKGHQGMGEGLGPGPALDSGVFGFPFGSPGPLPWALASSGSPAGTLGHSPGLWHLRVPLRKPRSPALAGASAHAQPAAFAGQSQCQLWRGSWQEQRQAGSKGFCTVLRRGHAPPATHVLSSKSSDIFMPVPPAVQAPAFQAGEARN